jgi:tetratricopeptide (TPR) repeat protein
MKSDDVNPEQVERYQLLYEQDPKSQIFAPLAESYRKMGLLKEGLEVAESGVQIHPNFAGGRVALGRLLQAFDRLKEAEQEYRKATELAPENMLAHQLLAEVLLRLKKPKDALHAYKILLFLNPDSEKAQRAVKKLEALTADEYEDDVFAMKPLKEAVKDWDEVEIDFGSMGGDVVAPVKPDKKSRFLDRVLSLVDAYIVRNEIDRAIETLTEAERLVGPEAEVVKRLKLIHHRQLENIPHPKSAEEIVSPPQRQSEVDNKIEFLQDLLQQIKTQRGSHDRNK